MEILAVKALAFKYPLCDRPVLKDISFSVERGSFTTVCGATGSGKTTLLKLLKPELAALGQKSGSIFFKGCEINSLSTAESAGGIGYVSQQPEQQLVTDKVWHELAFGLENLGLPSGTIRRRVAETAAFFGIEELFERNVSELSGGQKQLLSLASVMCMQPDILLLDEPTAQLDPIAASEFISTLRKLNRELSTTIIIVEHRLEEVLPLSDNLLLLKDGAVIAFGPMRETVLSLGTEPEILAGMPAALRLFCSLDAEAECPITIREGRAFIEKNYDNSIERLEAIVENYADSGESLEAVADKQTVAGTRENTRKKPEMAKGKKAVLELKELYFRYSRELPDVLKALELKVYEGESLCILGGNGSGKSTTLAVAAGILRPYSGKVRVFDKAISEYKGQALYRNCIALLPQDVQTLFLCNRVKEELAGLETADFPFDFSSLENQHPYDLSGGQQQLLGLAKLLAAKPKILLLDEPTKGLDAYNKALFAEVLAKIKASGVTIVCVTHDLEFSALIADRICLMFRGEIVADDEPREFFDNNNFYTTAANRMARGYYKGVCRLEDLILLCRRNGKKNGDDKKR